LRVQAVDLAQEVNCQRAPLNMRQATRQYNQNGHDRGNGVHRARFILDDANRQRTQSSASQRVVDLLSTRRKSSAARRVVLVIRSANQILPFFQ
jgi:hypothetical protein